MILYIKITGKNNILTKNCVFGPFCRELIKKHTKIYIDLTMIIKHHKDYNSSSKSLV